MSSTKKPALGSLPKDPTRRQFDSAIKERLEIISGERGTPISQLSTNASLSDVINKINEILSMLQ